MTTNRLACLLLWRNLAMTSEWNLDCKRVQKQLLKEWSLRKHQTYSLTLTHASEPRSGGGLQLPWNKWRRRKTACRYEGESEERILPQTKTSTEKWTERCQQVWSHQYTSCARRHLRFEYYKLENAMRLRGWPQKHAKLLTIRRTHHPKADENRMYLPSRIIGGRGLSKSETAYKSTTIGLEPYLKRWWCSASISTSTWDQKEALLHPKRGRKIHKRINFEVHN